MARYRWTVQTWDRHFGPMHAVKKRFWEARDSKKMDAQAVAELQAAIKTVTPQGESLAIAEVSGRFGPETLAKYVNNGKDEWERVK